LRNEDDDYISRSSLENFASSITYLPKSIKTKNDALAYLIGKAFKETDFYIQAKSLYIAVHMLDDKEKVEAGIDLKEVDDMFSMAAWLRGALKYSNEIYFRKVFSQTILPGLLIVHKRIGNVMNKLMRYIESKGVRIKLDEVTREA